jgi:hypothetical protein
MERRRGDGHVATFAVVAIVVVLVLVASVVWSTTRTHDPVAVITAWCGDPPATGTADYATGTGIMIREDGYVWGGLGPSAWGRGKPTGSTIVGSVQVDDDTHAHFAAADGSGTAELTKGPANSSGFGCAL